MADAGTAGSPTTRPVSSFIGALNVKYGPAPFTLPRS